MFVDIGAMNTYTGIVILHVTFHLSMAIFLFTGFISTIPRELDEAAMIDGASRLGLFFSDYLTGTHADYSNGHHYEWCFDLERLSVLGIFFCKNWNIERSPLPYPHFFGENNSDIGWVAAGSLLAALPSILLYLFLQKIFRGRNDFRGCKRIIDDQLGDQSYEEGEAGA